MYEWTLTRDTPKVGLKKDVDTTTETKGPVT